MVIGRFVDWLVDSAIIRGGKVLQALDVHCRTFLTMNVWPDDLHGAELRGANVQAASGSGVSASDSTAPADASPLGPVGSAVRDTTSPTAADGVAGEDAPQNQPPVTFPPAGHECVCRACNCPEYLHLLKPGFIAGPLKCEGCPLGCRDYIPCLCDDQPVGEFIDPQVLLAGHADYERVKSEFNQK